MNLRLGERGVDSSTITMPATGGPPQPPSDSADPEAQQGWNSVALQRKSIFYEPCKILRFMNTELHLDVTKNCRTLVHVTKSLRELTPVGRGRLGGEFTPSFSASLYIEIVILSEA